MSKSQPNPVHPYTNYSTANSLALTGDLCLEATSRLLFAPANGLLCLTGHYNVAAMEHEMKGDPFQKLQNYLHRF